MLWLIPACLICAAVGVLLTLRERTRYEISCMGDNHLLISDEEQASSDAHHVYWTNSPAYVKSQVRLPLKVFD